MRPSSLTLMFSLFVFGACGGEPPAEVDAGSAEAQEPTMGEMDHSQHQAGAPSERQAVHLTPQQERALGVRYYTVQRRPLERTIRTVGRIVASESRVAEVSPKVEGFIESLLVNTTGASVRRGEPLMTVYSPALVAAQEELIIAARLASDIGAGGGTRLENALSTLEAARRRLRYWDITDRQVADLEETGEVSKTLTLVSPVNGVVLEKNVVEGRRVAPGATLYRIADLSEVWVEGEVFERDLALIHEGMEAHIEVSAFPGEHLMAQVEFVHPVMDVLSRTNRVRVALPNPGNRLKPGMFATVFFDASVGSDALSVPLEAVIVTGERNLVFTRDESGMLSPREVVLGVQAGDFVQVLAGLEAGE
ncbi:MAG: efflux RND transporter periplasmic adaptor subunit, partial [Gemmatimonadota bacterium]|nr:efflux RND transporter periplasmic adaptor subunit [Gemmatimonadota bacterium]